MTKKTLLYRHLLIIFLPLSLFYLPTKSLWQSLDIYIFHSLNSYIASQPIQRIFWTLANIKITDLFGAFFLLGYFILYIFAEEGAARRKRIAHTVYALVWFEITILFNKQVLNPIFGYFSFYRHSPTAFLSDAYHFSLLVPWVKTKDVSYCCFPGDHATIVFQWCAFLWFFAGRKRGLWAFSISTLFLLPRLISGAHWTSDLLVGSASIVLLTITWATYPAILNRGLSLLYRCTRYKESSNISPIVPNN